MDLLIFYYWKLSYLAIIFQETLRNTTFEVAQWVKALAAWVSLSGNHIIETELALPGTHGRVSTHKHKWINKRNKIENNEYKLCHFEQWWHFVGSKDRFLTMSVPIIHDVFLTALPDKYFCWLWIYLLSSLSTDRGELEENKVIPRSSI